MQVTNSAPSFPRLTGTTQEATAQAEAMLASQEAVAAQVHGDDVVVYQEGQEGLKPLPLHVQDTGEGFFDRVFLPKGMPDSVSPDYVKSRKWMAVHDFASSATDYLGTSSALNAVGVGSAPLSVAMALMLRDGMDGVGSLVGSKFAPCADRDPKAWEMNGELINTAGTVLETSLALVPGAFLAVAPAANAIKAVGSSAKGAANKPIEVHQARANNLGEVSSKNGVQNKVTGALGGAVGLGLGVVGKGVIGPLATPLLAAGFGALQIFAMHKYTQSLDMDQLTEKSVGRLVKSWIEKGDYARPEGTPMLSLHRSTPRKLELGSDLEPFMQDRQRFDELRSLYSGRDYMLDVHGDKVDVLLRQGADEKDQFQAVMQAVLLQLLRRGDAYEQKKDHDGEVQADRWAVETSLRATPSDPQPMLDELKKIGWESDEINFKVDGARAKWQDLPAPNLTSLSREELASLVK